MNFLESILRFLPSKKNKPSSEPLPFEARDPIPWQRDFPPTLLSPPNDPDGEEGYFFDPSLKHFARAYRRGDPPLPAAEKFRWEQARRTATQHCLNIVARLPDSDHLVLRGSVMMKAMLGARCREPGDIDWVVWPERLEMKSSAGTELMQNVIEAVRRSAQCGDISIEAAQIARNDIWTYDRVPGHRIVFPWQAGDLPQGIVQMDFVFGEKLFTPRCRQQISIADGATAELWTASPEESLAWKLLWLFTDTYPQGKDLYDAVLLAESCSLAPELMQTVLHHTDSLCWNKMTPEFPFHSVSKGAVELEWGGFSQGDALDLETGTALRTRLSQLIAPCVTQLLSLKPF